MARSPRYRTALVLAMMTLSASAQTPGDGASVTLEGRVMDTRGAPVEGAKIFLHLNTDHSPLIHRGKLPEAPKPVQTNTNAQGFFRFENLARNDRFNLWIEHPGYLTVKVPLVEVPTAEPLRIELKTGRVLAGRVVNRQGAPIVNATLTRMFQTWTGTETGIGGFRSMSGSSSKLGSTGPDGSFRITGLEPGSIDLRVSAKGYNDRRLDGIGIPEDRDVESLEIVLDPGSAFNVRVLDSQGKPVAGAWVNAELEDWDLEERGGLGSFSADCDTDEEGRCRLELPRPGRYHVFVQEEQGEATAIGDTEAGTTSIELRLAVGAAATEPPSREEPGQPVDITGRLLGLPPEELARAQVIASGRGFNQLPGTVDSNGSYRISDVPSGEWWSIQAYTPAGYQAQASIDLKPGSPDVVLDLDLSGLTLSGRVLVDGAPLSGADVQAWEGTNGARDRTHTAYDGSFTFRSLHRGTYNLVLGPEGGIGHVRTVDLTEEDQNVVLQISTGKIAGRLVSKATGEPVADTTVLLDFRHSAIDHFFSVPSARSDANGVFESVRLAPGTYKLQVRKEGFAPAETIVTLRSGETPEIGIPLTPTG